MSVSVLQAIADSLRELKVDNLKLRTSVQIEHSLYAGILENASKILSYKIER